MQKKNILKGTKYKFNKQKTVTNTVNPILCIITFHANSLNIPTKRKILMKRIEVTKIYLTLCCVSEIHCKFEDKID